MNKSILALAFVLLVVGLKAEDDWELPELGVNQDAANCRNYKLLQAAAEGDDQRLRYYVDSQIPRAQDILSRAAEFSSQACEYANKVHTSGSFLQTNEKSTARTDLSRRGQEIKEESKKLGLTNFEKIVQDKINVLTEEMDKITSEKVPIDEINNVCGDVSKGLREINSYLNWASEEISTKWIGGYIPKRTAFLGTFYQQNCMSVVQSGSYSQVLDSSSTLKSKTSSAKRLQTFTVTFPFEFGNTPSVAVSLTGFDLDSGYPSIIALVSRTDKKSFDVTMIAAPYSSFNAFQFSWIAFDSSKTSAYVNFQTIDYLSKTVTDLAGNYQTPGDRTYTRTWNHNKNLANPKAAVSISGFSFKGTEDANLAVSVTNLDSNSISYQFATTGSTILYTAVLYAVIYDDVNANSNKDLGVTSSSTLFEAARSDTFGQEFGFSCANEIHSWPTLNSFSYNKNKSIRLTEKVSSDANGVTVNLSAGSSDQLLKSLSAGVFAYCNPRAF